LRALHQDLLVHNVKNMAVDGVHESRARLPEPHCFGRLVHAMLHHQHLNVTLHSRDGGTYRPREWFDVEFDIARQVVTIIVDGSIAKYQMGHTIGQLVLKKGVE